MGHLRGRHGLPPAVWNANSHILVCQARGLHSRETWPKACSAACTEGKGGLKRAQPFAQKGKGA